MVATLLASGPASLSAQSPTWQPSRLPQAHSSQVLPNSHLKTGQPASRSQTTASASTVPSAAPASQGGVQLRWRASSRTIGQSTDSPTASSALVSAPTSTSPSAADRSDVTSAAAAQLANDAWLANPLRATGSDGALTSTSSRHSRQTVATQGEFAPRNSGHSIGRGSPSSGSVRMAAYQPPVSPLPGQGNAVLPPPQLQPSTLPPTQLPSMPNDPLSQPEQAPLPPSERNGADTEFPDIVPAKPLGELTQPGQVDPNKGEFPGQSSNLDSGSPSDRQEAGTADQSEEFDQLGRRKSRPDSLTNCESFRNSLRSATLDKVNLNSAPRYGQGLGVDADEAEKMRQDFAAASQNREWCDREGRALVQGRMVDLRNEQVVLDINGARREIPLRDLCDVDLAYIGKAWNLPISCGSGYDQVAGRGFTPSAMQWKASGLCHKPLYFEEVQLERYGHEIGPLLQPVVSTVHFFGNIAVLPYKMGINPPNECQYALGYYRPGDCAPYMLPPIPLSLRGAAVQAGVVTGAAALIP